MTEKERENERHHSFKVGWNESSGARFTRRYCCEKCVFGSGEHIRECVTGLGKKRRKQKEAKA